MLKSYDFNYLIKKDTALPQEKQTCRVCLGLLQQVDRKELVEEMLEEIRRQGYQFEEFIFQHKILTSIDIRYFVMQRQIEQEYRSTHTDQEWDQVRYFFQKDQLYQIIQMKQLIKHVIVPIFEQRLGCKYNQDQSSGGLLTIHVSYLNDQDDQDMCRPFFGTLQRMQQEKEQIKKKVKHQNQVQGSGQKTQGEQFPITKSTVEKVIQIPFQEFLEVSR